MLAADMKHPMKSADFSFVQISDSHIGFNKPANPDVNGTLNAAVAKINSLEKQPEFIHSHRRHLASRKAGRV